MKLLILLCAIVLGKATVPENFDGIQFSNSPVLYQREVIKSGLNTPYRLAVHHNTNTLYFGYYTDFSSKPAKIDLNDMKFENITSVPEAFAIAIDNTGSEVYISGVNRIYKYDPETNKTRLYAATYGNKIWSLYFHDYLYYTVVPLEYVRVLKYGTNVRAEDVEGTEVEFFVIDKDGDIFYTNDTGVYGQKKGEKHAELYKKFDDVSATFLTTDKNGEVYVSMFDNTIYIVNKDAKTFDYLVQIDNHYSIAFDKDNNILYSDDNNIYILKPNENLCC